MKNTLILLLAVLGLYSCKPEPGCMDMTATNYSPDAEEDDGSCLYNASCSCYYDDYYDVYFATEEWTGLSAAETDEFETVCDELDDYYWILSYSDGGCSYSID